MAEAPLDPLDCPLCLERLTEPVTLGCEHCFCSACLRKHWGQSSTGNCPECNRRWSKDWEIYFALKEQTDFTQRQMEKSEEQTGEKEVVRTESPEDAQTSSTDKDKQESLPATGVSSLQKQGSEESELKEQLQSQIKSLREKTECVKAKEKHYLEMLQHSERQTQHCETQIRAQFNRFHQFLKQEEETCLSTLRQEQEKKTWIMELELKNIQSELSRLSRSIQSAEEQLQRDPTASLRDYMQNLSLTNVSELDPQMKTGLLIDQAKVLGNLGYRVWKKMSSLVQHSPVILDPNSANRWLCLSEDLTSVRLGDSLQQQVPLNPERFTNYSSVLGSEGFSSGTHQWIVEVGDLPTWFIGLAKESANRTARCSALPKDGFWCLMHDNNEYSDVVGKAVKLRRCPEKICVIVDYNRGQISFYDKEDMALICTHKDTFTEKVFPYFSVGRGNVANTKDIKIVHAHLKVTILLRSQTRSESVSSGSQETKTKPKKSELSEKDPLRRLEPDPETKTKPKKSELSEKDPLRRLEPDPETKTKPKKSEMSEKVPSRKFGFLSPRESRPKTSERTEKKPFSSFRQRSKLEPQTGPESSERSEKSN